MTQQPPQDPFPHLAVPSAPWGPLAGWGTRVAASLPDSLVGLIGGCVRFHVFAMRDGCRQVDGTAERASTRHDGRARHS